MMSTEKRLHTKPSSSVKQTGGRLSIGFVCLVLTPLLGVGLGKAAGFPDRTIKVVTPFAAGAASDVELRLLAGKMSDRMKVPVVVENHPGAGGLIAARTVTNAPHDGYTIAWVGNNTAIGVNLFANPSIPAKRWSRSSASASSPIFSLQTRSRGSGR